MIFRAIFCFALVAVLLPHEPNIGYGRPDQDGSLIAKLRIAVQSNVIRVRNELRAENGGKESETARFAERLTGWGRHAVAAGAGAADPIAAKIVEMTAKAHPDRTDDGKFSLHAGDSLP